MRDVTRPSARALTISPQFDISAFVAGLLGIFGGSVTAAGVASFFDSFWSVFTVFSYIISAILLYGTIYAMMRFGQLSEEMQDRIREEEHAYKHAHGRSVKDQQWEGITAHAHSENPNDWRLAIIEADIMLDAVLNRAGFLGASIGDKLKSANPSSLNSLQDAWNAHKIRNAIAHQGSDFVLTKKVTQETINQYERVFEELGAV